MNTENRPVSKRCPKCKQSDLTDFSTCRFCASPYDQLMYRQEVRAKSPYKTPGMSLGAIFAVTLLISFPFGAFYLYSQGMGNWVTTHSFRRGTRPNLMAAPLAVAVFFGKKEIASAQDTIKKETAVLATDPRNYDALVQRADAYWTQFQMNQALADYTAAISLRPQSPDAYEKRATSYEAMGNYDLAKKDRDTAKSLAH